MYGVHEILKTVPPNKRAHSWAGRLVRAGYGFDEIEQAVERDDWHIRPEDQRKIKQADKQKIAELKNEIDQEWQRERRSQYIQDKIEKLEGLYKRLTKVNCPFWVIRVIWGLNQGDKWLRLDKLMKSGYSRKEQITLEMIEQARDYPITELVEVNRAGFALCVNHSDTKPSMYCKNNYAYCFSCGYKADTISLCMKINNLTFPEAVKRLAIC